MICEKNLKGQRGITLVALVITIVILLILAGVSMSLITGDGGLFGRAQSAVDNYKEASEREKVAMDAAIYATVTFDTNGGTAVEEQHIIYGQKAIEPGETPTRTTGIFLGWYSDEELTTEYNFNTIVWENTTLYAKWANDGQGPEDYTITSESVTENSITLARNKHNESWKFGNKILL